MKIATKIVIAIILIICISFFGLLPVYFTSWENAKINNLNVCYNKVTGFCFAGAFEWDGNIENMTFTVPDEYEGMKIKSLGHNSTPALFYVMVPESFHPEVVSCTESEDCSGTVNEDAITYTFTVKLGKNIKHFEDFTYKEYFMDADDNVVYIVEIKYECSPENTWAYSKDGKLYDKDTKQLLGGTS